ncbi:MAG TPA: hypothetical protein PK228_04080 [Saprospiraceae bacterium]|nr:hypothetical protein [Saprospiraceae bacterium]
MHFSVSKRILKILAIVLAVFFVLLFIFMRFYLSPMLRVKLVDAVSQGSDGLYALEMEGLQCNLLTGSARMEQLWLHTDTALLSKLRREQPGRLFLEVDLRMPELNVRHAKFLASYFSRNIRLGAITMVDPVLYLRSIRDSVITAQPDSIQKSLLDRLPDFLSPDLKSLLVERFNFQNGAIEYQTITAGKRTAQSADSIHCVLDRICVEKNPQLSENRTLYADDITLDFKNYTFSTSTTPYLLAVGAGAMSGSGEVLTLHGFSTGPKINDEEFVSRQKWRKARIRLDLEKVEITRLDFFRMLHRGEWAMETVEVKNGKLDVLIDKNVVHVPAKKMPNEVMRALDFRLSIDSILAKNIDILLTEVKPEGKGEISFSNARVKIINLSNDPARMSDAAPARIYVTCSLMGKAQLDLTVMLPLLSKDFACSYHATLGTMPMSALNPLFEKDNLILEAGELKSVTLDATTRNGIAEGALIADYSDLKIKLVNADDKKKKRSLSWMANVLVRSNNKNAYLVPSGRTGKMDYQRVPGDDLLRFMWRSARNGLLDILIPGVKVPFPPD